MAKCLDGADAAQLLSDLDAATVSEEVAGGSQVSFSIAGYHRPESPGQHQYPMEGSVMDADGVEIEVLLFADGNNRLIELELIRWGTSEIIGPNWDTFKTIIRSDEPHAT